VRLSAGTPFVRFFSATVCQPCKTCRFCRAGKPSFN